MSVFEVKSCFVVINELVEVVKVDAKVVLADDISLDVNEYVLVDCSAVLVMVVNEESLEVKIVRDVVSLDVVSLDVVSLDVVSLDVVSLDVVSLDVVSLDVVSLDVVSLDVVSLDVVSLDVVSLDVVNVKVAISFELIEDNEVDTWVVLKMVGDKVVLIVPGVWLVPIVVTHLGF